MVTNPVVSLSSPAADRRHAIPDAAPRDVRYQVERLAEIWEELQPLFAAHYREISVYPDIPLDMDKERYLQGERAGVLRCYTVRSVGAELVGYAVFIVQRALHYRGSLQAAQDLIFVRRDYRGGGVGGGLISYCDEDLAAIGVQVVSHHTKAHHDFGPLLERLGYTLNERAYTRRLDR